MTITEMIAVLTNVHAKHGDLDVMTRVGSQIINVGLVKWDESSPDHIYLKEEGLHIIHNMDHLNAINIIHGIKPSSAPPLTKEMFDE